jgi:hypothetical protein
LTFVANAGFKILYERKEVTKKMREEEEPVSFKQKTKINLGKATAKVRPGMMVCDDKLMTQAMRQASKVEYRDFRKIQEQNAHIKQKIQQAKSTVPGHEQPEPKLVSRFCPEEPQVLWYLDKSLIKTSIPKAAKRSKSQPKRIMSFKTPDFSKRVKLSVPSRFVLKQEKPRARETR